MLRPFFALGGTLWLGVAILAAEPKVEIGYVAVKHAVLRSGPGADFFATERVPWGTRLEIYQEIDGSWCAVRPLNQSFSWVPAEAIQVVADDPGTGEVQRAGTAVRVGSHLNDRRDVESVTLKKGERVTILGSESGEAGEESPAEWYKIAPPSGEFRWIHRAEVQASPPHFAAKSPSRVRLPKHIGDSPGEDAKVGTPLEDPLAIQPEATHQPEATEAVAMEAVEVEDLTEPDRLPVGLAAGTEEQSIPKSAWHAAQGSGGNEPAVGPTAPQPLGLSVTTVPETSGSTPTEEHDSHDPSGESNAWDESTRLALQRIAAELDSMVREPTRMWNFADLTSRTQEIASTTRNPDLQSDALELLGTIDRFQRILTRHEQLVAANRVNPAARPTLPTDTAGLRRTFQSLWSRVAPYRPNSANPFVGNPGGGIRAPTAQSPGPEKSITQYDGSGRLMPVFSSRSGVPQYALTDQEGHIFQYVQAQPGLNLRPYLRQEVGVIGQKRFAPDLEKPVLTAEQITVLNRR